MGRSRWSLPVALLAGLLALSAADASLPSGPADPDVAVQEAQDAAADAVAALPLTQDHDSPSEPTAPAPSPHPGPAPPPRPSLLDSAMQKADESGKAAIDLVAQVPSQASGLASMAQGTAQRAAETIRASALPDLEQQAEEPKSPQGGAGTVTTVSYPLLAGGLLVAGAAGATFLGLWLAGSSGAAGAGAAAGSSAAGKELRRLLPFASPLFTRFEKDTVLGHPRREALYAQILQNPGISLQALGDATGLSRTAVLHHLRLLELQHLIVSKRMGRSRHYYENGGRFGRDQKEAFAVLQNARSKDVADYIKSHPGAIQKEVCASLGIQPSIAHWHVRRLQAAELVEAVRKGRTVTYYPGRALSQLHAMPLAAEAPATA